MFDQANRMRLKSKQVTYLNLNIKAKMHFDDYPLKNLCISFLSPLPLAFNSE